MSGARGVILLATAGTIGNRKRQADALGIAVYLPNEDLLTLAGGRAFRDRIDAELAKPAAQRPDALTPQRDQPPADAEAVSPPIVVDSSPVRQNISPGTTNLDLDRVLSNVTRYRISLFEFTGPSSVETVHVKINYDTQNYDETNDIFYNLFFVSYTNGTITYTPAIESEGWHDIGSMSSHNIHIYIDGSLADAVADDITSRNCYIEIEYR